jgi:hypothetical protein
MIEHHDSRRVDQIPQAARQRPPGQVRPTVSLPQSRARRREGKEAEAAFAGVSDSMAEKGPPKSGLIIPSGVGTRPECQTVASAGTGYRRTLGSDAVARALSRRGLALTVGSSVSVLHDPLSR